MKRGDIWLTDIIKHYSWIVNFLTLKNVYFSHPNLSKGVIWKSFLSESSWSFHSLYNSRCMFGIFCFSKGNSWSVKLGRLWLHGSKSNNWSVKLGNSSWNSHRTRHDCCMEKDRMYARWLIGKEPTCQFSRCRFDPWIGKIPWRRKWQSSPVYLPGKSYGQRSLVGYSPWGHKELDTT